METKNSGQVILAVLFIIYLLVGYQIPPHLAITINQPVSRVILLLLAFYLFVHFHPILGVLGVFVVLHLMYQSSNFTSSYSSHGVFHPSLKPYYPTEQLSRTNLNPAHQFPYTLEQEVVKKMTTLHEYNDSNQIFHWKPVLDDTYNASPLTQHTNLLYGVPKLGCS